MNFNRIFFYHNFLYFIIRLSQLTGKQDQIHQFYGWLFMSGESTNGFPSWRCRGIEDLLMQGLVGEEPVVEMWWSSDGKGRSGSRGRRTAMMAGE